MEKSVPMTQFDPESRKLIERPDGFYWRNHETAEEFGPFANLAEAVADMEYQPDPEVEPAETLEEAEDELGIANWIDPETGEPAEDSVPHIEEH